MNTKTDGISSELVAVAYIEHHKAGDNLNWERVDHAYATASPLVRLSGAEAIIAAKDAEIERLKKENVGYASNLRGKHSVSGATYQHMQTTISQQAERIKELETEMQSYELIVRAEDIRIKKQSAALKLARGLLDRIANKDEQEHTVGFALEALAAIDEVLKGE